MRHLPGFVLGTAFTLLTISSVAYRHEIVDTIDTVAGTLRYSGESQSYHVSYGSSSSFTPQMRAPQTYYSETIPGTAVHREKMQERHDSDHPSVESDNESI